VKRLNTCEFINKAFNVHDDKYDYSLVNYIGALTHVDIICKIHGIFKQKPNNHLNGYGCPKCSRISFSNKIYNKFIEKAKILHENKYDYSKVIYVNTNQHVEIICPKHGIFNQSPNNHLKGCGCPYCKESIGEKKIADFLLKNSIKFERGKKFNDCKNSYKLAFDFFLPDNNLLIEYDGIQHFLPFNYYGGENKLCKQKTNDRIKDEFAKSNNYSLLRIKYDKLNEINNILETHELRIIR
jgi:very-short-patch-repair endonuclease